MATSELTARPATRSAAVLDDADSRPGSATSLLRTIVGCYLRRLGGWIAAEALIELMTTVGVNQARTRTAILRVRGKGLLAPEVREGHVGYALHPAAIPALARGDRRIYAPRQMGTSDRWCLISYSIPESQRQLRHQLRRRLSWIGCGTVTAALWICPEYLTGEVEEILSDLGVRASASIFLVGRDAGGRWARAGRRAMVGPTSHCRPARGVPVRVRICGGGRIDTSAGIRDLDRVLGRVAGHSLRRPTPACSVAAC